MKDVIIILAGFLLISLQSVVHQWIPLAYFTPDFLLPFVIYLGMIDYGAARGAALAFVLGYILDTCASAPVGVHLFVVPAIYLLYRFINKEILLSGWLFQSAMTLAASLSADLMIVGMRALFERAIPSWKAVALTLAFHPLATALCAPLVFWLGARLVPESPKRKEEKVVI